MNILEIKNISKSFGGLKAVDNCSFDVPAGCVIGLIGPNGAGKTTLFDILSGFVKADEGSVCFYTEDKKVDLRKLSPYKIANLGISRTFQNVRLFSNLTIKDHIYIALDMEDTKFWKNIFLSEKLYNTYSDGNWEEYIREYGIEKPLTTLVSDLSYGQRKLLQIALAILKKHSLVLFDEPVAGVNTLIKRKIEDIIIKLKQKGETMLIIEHDIQFIKNLADKVVVMDEGSVLKEGMPDEVLKDKKVIEAYLGD